MLLDIKKQEVVEGSPDCVVLTIYWELQHLVSFTKICVHIYNM